MAVETPVIVTKKASQFYRLACYLAQKWIPEWENAGEQRFVDDPGLVLFKLLAQLAEQVAERINRIPEKQLLAFYDFLGVAHQPPVAARAPLSFSIAAGSKEDVVVPVRTQVASSGDPEVVFETVEPLTVVNNTIKAIYSLNPWTDRYARHIDATGNLRPGLSLFGADADPLDHVVYLADPGFGVGAPATLGLKYHYMSGGSQKVKHCHIALPAMAKTTVNGDEAYWIPLTPENGLPPQTEQPEINPELRYKLKAARILPDTLLVNDSKVDPLKGFYPFGEIPKAGDVLYLGCAEVFSKTGAGLKVTLTQIAGIGNQAEVRWEYLGVGRKWTPILNRSGQNLVYDFTQETISLRFPCPEIPVFPLNGTESRWIRVILAKGCYNKEGSFDTSQTPPVYTPPVYTPPFITSLTLKYATQAKKVQRCKVYNTVEYQDIALEQQENLPFNPYPALGEYPALYIGLAAEPGQKQLACYFSMQDKVFGETTQLLTKPLVRAENASAQREVHWFYGSGAQKWSELEVEDETVALTRSGIVKLIVPVTMKVRRLFGEELFWLKAEVRAEQVEAYRLQGLFLNTVWGENTQRLQDELLGSSNGEADQEFTIAAHPILGSVHLEIQEPALPTGEELQILAAEEGDTAWRTVKDAEGVILEVWVRWHEVDSLIHSASLSRHYTVDRVNGRVRFGDGTHGMIPPVLPNNILAREYYSGGGKSGNQPALALTVLKTAVAGIEQVTNYAAAVGGRDLERIEDVVVRAPAAIKDFERAVTAEDFEFLARETTSEVLKAKCFYDGTAIKVIIVPDSVRTLPLPSAKLISQVAAALQEKVFVPIRDRISVCGPEYIAIDVRLTVFANSEAGTDLTERVQNRLKEYLDSIRGGNAATGWELGPSIFVAEVAAAVKEVPGVLYIEDLGIRKHDADSRNFVTSFLTLEADQLPCPGEIRVERDGG